MRVELHPDTEQEQALEHDLGFIVVASGGERARVLLHNDDVTPMDFVVYVLCAVFFLDGLTADRLMIQAHLTGIAEVMVLPLEEAKDRVGRAHSLARAAQYPLTLTIEVEADNERP